MNVASLRGLVECSFHSYVFNRGFPSAEIGSSTHSIHRRRIEDLDDLAEDGCEVRRLYAGQAFSRLVLAYPQTGVRTERGGSLEGFLESTRQRDATVPDGCH